MKKIRINKYQGAGNDFVIIDARFDQQELTQKEIEFLCHRKFGVGADGLMLLKNHSEYDFEMKYYNSDGNESSMCGNGGRCLVAFAYSLGVFTNKCEFIAIDGAHQAEMLGDLVRLKMIDVEKINPYQSDYVLFTGSPHYVQFQDSVKDLDVYQMGKNIRYSEDFRAEGINVNFVEKLNNSVIKVRTYERGVEDETLSCGTGVTACALVLMSMANMQSVEISTLGGKLLVEAQKTENSFQEIYLTGEAKMVFQTEIEIDEQEIEKYL